MNNIIELLIDNWYIILAAFAVGLVIGVAIYRFTKLPNDEQLDKVREWLLWAVTQAEKELGGGTGKLKLRQVYDLFITRFPQVAMLITFSQFSDLVDEALVEMRKMIKTNDAVQAHVEGL